MIKTDSSGLRIGNLLQDSVSKTILKVVELTENDVVTYVIDRNKFPLEKGWGLEGIPLTEEWLLKFRFDKDDERKGAYLGEQFSNNFNLIWEESLLGFGLEWKGWSLYQWGHIKYVHQLQNLFFALSGEELTLNAKTQ